MPFVLIGFLALVLVIYGLRVASNTPPAKVARTVKVGGGIFVALGALLVLLRGRIGVAAGLGGLSLWLFGHKGGWSDFFAAGGAGAKAAVSRATTRTVFMELDHKSGNISGQVLAGVFAGRGLDELSRQECDTLYQYCGASDVDAARLLETYFDRRFAGWRQAGQSETDARRGSNGARPGQMSEQQAYQTLGLQSGASRDEIASAHRALMKKLHPDHGGTTELAARVNEAKDVLMRRHT